MQFDIYLHSATYIRLLAIGFLSLTLIAAVQVWEVIVMTPMGKILILYIILYTMSKIYVYDMMI